MMARTQEFLNFHCCFRLEQDALSHLLIRLQSVSHRIQLKMKTFRENKSQEGRERRAGGEGAVEGREVGRADESGNGAFSSEMR